MTLDNLFQVIQQIGQKPYSTFVNNWARSSISQSASDFSNYSRNGFVFKQYANLEDAFNFIIETRNKPNKESYENSALNNVTDSKFDNFSSFTNNIKQPRSSLTKIKKIVNVLLENLKTLVNLGVLYKNDRIIITEDSRGIFDFGLASLGLYRPVEFYSEDLKNDIQNKIVANQFTFQGLENGVVDPSFINKKIIGNDVFYIYNYKNKEYFCERRQKGTTKVFTTFPKECFLKSNSEGIIITYDINNKEKVFNGKNDARLKYASNNKKSYLIYQKKDDSVKYVDIYMPINYLSGVNNSSRALQLIPSFLIASTLEEFGIQVRISAMRLGSDEETQITASIPVKDYNESTKEAFDYIFDLLSTSNSAESFFGFFKIMAGNEGIQAPPTKDTSTSFDDIAYENRNYMNNMMQRYKNWCEENKDKPFINTKVVNKNFQFALPTIGTNIASSVIEYEDILNYLHQIFFQYYYYMDFLAIEMINITDFVKSLYKRISEDSTFRKIFEVPSTNIEIKETIRSYILSILVEKYAIVNGGSYADNQEQKKQKEDTFQQKVLSLNEALNSI